MSSKDNSGGLMSSAGLVRYFDSEASNAIPVNPRTVMAAGVLVGVLVLMLQLFF